MFDEAFAAMRRRLHARTHAYKATFNGNPAGQAVLRDLAKICYFNRSTQQVSPVTKQIDPIATAIAEGRRQVYLHILAALNTTPDEMNRLAESRSIDE